MLKGDNRLTNAAAHADHKASTLELVGHGSDSVIRHFVTMIDAPLEESSLQDWLEEALRGWDAVDARAMFGSQAYLVGGKMFVALGNMGLLLKLPPQVREPLLHEGRAETSTVSSGASFGEWVALLPDRWQHDRQGLLSLVRQSYDYVQSAPPPAKPPREPRRVRKRQY